MSDITIDCNKANNPSGKCVILRGYESQIYNSNIQDSGAHGVLFTDLSANGTETSQGEANNRIFNNKFISNDGAGVYVETGPGLHTTDLFLTRNLFKSNGAGGTYCSIHAENAAGFHIVGNQEWGAPTCSMNLQKAAAAKIIGNSLEATDQTAAGVEIVSNTIQSYGWGDVTIAANTFFTSAASLGTASALTLLSIAQESQTAGVAVAGNTFRSNSFAATSIKFSGTYTATYPLAVGANSYNNFAPAPIPSKIIHASSPAGWYLYNTPGSEVFKVPADATVFNVIACGSGGGGGGGGRAAASISGGAGGGGGGSAINGSTAGTGGAGGNGFVLVQTK